MRFLGGRRSSLPSAQEALPGRPDALPVPAYHRVLKGPLQPPYPSGSQTVELALGCFWGAERIFWQTPGVLTTAVGYEGGFTPNPTYEEVCSGWTGHAETVRIVFDPARVSLSRLLAAFWESHDPTQGMRQGHDVGTQYRSVIFVNSESQRQIAEASRERYQQALKRAGYGAISTDIVEGATFYFAEEYHQQYLERHSDGYCGLGGTGIAYPVGLFEAAGEGPGAQ